MRTGRFKIVLRAAAMIISPLSNPDVSPVTESNNLFGARRGPVGGTQARGSRWDSGALP